MLSFGFCSAVGGGGGGAVGWWGGGEGGGWGAGLAKEQGKVKRRRWQAREFYLFLVMRFVGLLLNFQIRNLEERYG